MRMLSPKTIALLLAFATLPLTASVANAQAPTTYSSWLSITRNQGQFIAQPGRTIPLTVLGLPPVGGLGFLPGQYMIYVATSDPNGLSISSWTTHGPYAFRVGEKWKATLVAENEQTKVNDLRMEKDHADLLQYTIPSGSAMIYARNPDTQHWRSICVLPVGGGMTVENKCFGGSNNVVYAPDPTPPTVKVFTNGNDGGVVNQPTKPTVFTLNTPTQITQIMAYHWNNGRGTPATGTIALRSGSGQTYGPWQTTGQPGQGGAPNCYWIATPNVALPAGTYTVVDSDPATWAHNGGSGGAGMAVIDGYPK